MTLFTWTNLHLLREELVFLSRTPFFSPSLEAYLEKLIKIVEIVIGGYDTFNPQGAEKISQHVWAATKYLKGGTSKAVPYETVYALKLALCDWINSPCEITTALSEDLDYHFRGVDPAKIIRTFVPDVDFNTELIQIALPKLYRHRPLYNVALYHELGHYIDSHFKLSEYSLIANPVPSDATPLQQQVAINHRKEFFADLFAASYSGVAIKKFLEAVAGGQAISYTHPATVDRIKNIDDKLAGVDNPIINLFSSVLLELKLPHLTCRYKLPDVANAFDNIRTYKIEDDQELHGIMEAGWLFLEDAHQQKKFPWENLPKEDISRITNDLIEKSIRNRMTRLKWDHANS